MRTFYRTAPDGKCLYPVMKGCTWAGRDRLVPAVAERATAQDKPSAEPEKLSNFAVTLRIREKVILVRLECS